MVEYGEALGLPTAQNATLISGSIRIFCSHDDWIWIRWRADHTVAVCYATVLLGLCYTPFWKSIIPGGVPGLQTR